MDSWDARAEGGEEASDEARPSAPHTLARRLASRLCRRRSSARPLAAAWQLTAQSPAIRQLRAASMAAAPATAVGPADPDGPEGAVPRDEEREELGCAARAPSTAADMAAAQGALAWAPGRGGKWASGSVGQGP